MERGGDERWRWLCFDAPRTRREKYREKIESTSRCVREKKLFASRIAGENELLSMLRRCENDFLDFYLMMIFQ